MEIYWKQINLIKGYEDLRDYYEVSNTGEFRSKEFSYVDKNGVKYTKKEKILTLSKTNTKSPRVSFKTVTDSNISKNAAAIVAKAFILNPNNFPALEFIDGNYDNLNSNNLNWTDAKLQKYDKIESLPNEIWKIIPETSGFYSVSNLGRIKSNSRNYFPNGSKDVMFVKEASILSPTFEDKTGYYSVGLLINGKPKTKRVHRIVAETFIPNPENLSHVDHIDEDKSNNSVSNLRWLSAKNNSIHSNSTKIIVTFPDKITTKICNSISEAALLTGYNEHSIAIHCKRQSQQKEGNYGFRWKDPESNSKIKKKIIENEIREQLNINKFNDIEYLIKCCNITPNYHNLKETIDPNKNLGLIWKKTDKLENDFELLITVPYEHYLKLLDNRK